MFSRVSIIRSPGDSVTSRERIFRESHSTPGDARLRPLARAVGVACLTDSSLCGSDKTFMSHNQTLKLMQNRVEALKFVTVNTV